MSRTLTVNKLIEQLQELAEAGCGEYSVMFTCDYGNHSHTQQALPVKSADELGEDERIAESLYSQSGLAVEEFDHDALDDLDVVEEWRTEEHNTNFVILR